MARESQCPLSDGPPEPRDGLDGPLEPHGPGRRWLGRTSRRGVRKESESLKPAAAPFCVQLLGRTETPPFVLPRAPQRREHHLQKDGTPRWLRGSSPLQRPFVAVCSQGHLKRMNRARCLHGRGSCWPDGQWCRPSPSRGGLPHHGAEGGQGWVTPSCPFLSTLGPEGAPHPALGLGAAQGRRGWPGEPGRVTGGCPPRSPSPGEPVPWEKAARRQKQLSLPALGPQGCCQPASHCQGSLEASPAGARPLRRRSPRDTASPG